MRLRGLVELGKLNQLVVVKEVDFGIYLDGGEFGEVLLPHGLSDTVYSVGETAEVFLYLDSEDRVVATTRQPYAMVGQVANLKVAATTPVGAFLDWGLDKDLLVPFSEQKEPMVKGESYLVVIYIDLSNRIVASAKLDKKLDREPPHYKPGEQVELMICDYTDIGYKAAINGTHWGVLYRDEVFRKLSIGQAVTGYIKKVRDDQKIDLLLDRPGYQQDDKLARQIVRFLKEHDGHSTISDKSSPEVISRVFGVSKKKFKQCIGMMFKNGQIRIEKDGIHLL